ncbi:MAG: hypothetical protein ACLUNI_04345 [Dialister invisus]|uniref:hypothetical protein n=1 Tax=Dialister invisus TaxID=218538 RepID=UPI00399280EF
MLDKELSADKVIVGKAGADGKDGVIGVNGKDGVSGVGINGKDGISVKGDKGEVGINGNDGISIKGKDGKDAVTINGKDGVPGVDGKEGHIGLNGKDGITDIWTRPGQPGLNGANGTTMTRVVYKDPKGNEHEVATLDDGLKFAGDDGQTDKSKVIAKLLNKTMDIVGGADNTKLTDGNIGVNNVNGKLQVQLASALNGITSISNGKAGSNNTTITLGDGTVNVGGSTISNVKSALNGTALANASEDQKKSAATIGDLKDAVNNMSGDVNWVIQDANTPKGTKTINSTTPLTVKGDKYVKTTVNNDGLNLGLDEDQLNNTITNNNTVQNNKTDISNLKAGFNLKAGATTSQVKLGEATTPTIEFATADDTMTVNLSDKKVTYGIDKNKLINNINNTTNNPVTNIKAQFGVTADSGSQKTVTLTKDTTPTVKFKGDGKYLTSVTDTDGVQYSVDENKLNQNITNITNEAIKGKGLYFGANSGATVLNKLGSTVKIQGEGTKADSEYSGENIKTKVSQDASGNTNINMMLASALNGITSISNGKAGSNNTTITLGDGTVNVGGSTISNVKSALNGTALANASEDQKKSAATIGDLKDAVNNMSGDVNWVIQDANTPKGTKTINSTTPLTVKGDKYVKTTVNNDGLNLGLDEDQLNNTITNNNTVQNNKTDISNLKAGFNLKAGATTSQVKLGEATTPTIEFATADDTMTVNLSDKKVTYGIDKNKLINNINNTTNNPVTNIKAQFGVTADSGSQKTVTLTKDTTPTVKFKGDGKYLTSVTDTDGVQYSVDENKLNQNITNITNEAIKGKGLYFWSQQRSNRSEQTGKHREDPGQKGRKQTANTPARTLRPRSARTPAATRSSTSCWTKNCRQTKSLSGKRELTAKTELSASTGKTVYPA